MKIVPIPTEAMDDYITDMQARAFCAHAERNPRLKELAGRDYNELSRAEQEELCRLFDIAELSFEDSPGSNWWE